MNLVKQTYSESCFLACIESFLIIKGIKRSQQDMIDLLLAKKLCNLNGKVSFGKEPDVGKALNLLIKPVQYQFPIHPTYPDNSLIITIKEPPQNNVLLFHAVLYCCHLNDKEIKIMNPSSGGSFRKWDEKLLVLIKHRFFLLALE